MALRKIFIGTVFTAAVRVFRLLAQFIAIPILTRLLTPGEYGLVAILMPFVFFAMMLADAGIGMSLVRTSTANRATWSGGFWLVVAFGILFTLVMVTISPILAFLFEEPQLRPMLQLLSLVILMQAVQLIPISAMQQAGRFRSISIIEVTATIAGIATAVYFAYHKAGAWALIYQQLVFFGVRAVFFCSFSSFRPQWTFVWATLREHVHFGRDMLTNSLLGYATRTLDPWIIGKILGTAALGFQSIALQFARLPITVVTAPLQYVLYAQLAPLKDNPYALGRICLLITRLLAIITLPTMAAVAVAHEPIFTLLLSKTWTLSGVLFMLAAPATAAQTITAVAETILLTHGRTDVQIRNTAEYGLLWLVVLLTVASHGLMAIGISFTLITLLYQFRLLARILPPLKVKSGEYFIHWLTPLLVSGGIIMAYRIITARAGLSPIATISLASLLALLGITTAALISRNGIRTEWAQARHYLAQA